LWRRTSDGRPPRLARVYDGHQKDLPIQQIDFASDGTFFVSCSADRTAKAWEVVPDVATLDAERLPAVITYISPQAELGGDKRLKFHAEVDNSKGLLMGNTTATIVLYPERN
jgi:WD40 repeat protein